MGAEKRAREPSSSDDEETGAVPPAKARLLDIFDAKPEQPVATEAPKSADPKEVFKHEERKRKYRAVRKLVVYVTSSGKVARTDDEEARRRKTTLFVDNLPNDVTKRELEVFFRRCKAAPAGGGDKSTGDGDEKGSGTAGAKKEKMTVRIRSQHFDHTKEEKGLFKTNKLNVIKGRLAKEGTCSAYVFFPTAEEYERGLELDGELFMEHHVRIEPAQGGPTPFNSDTSLFLGNLLLELTDEELRAFIESKDLEVKKVRLIRDTQTRKGKGFGYVSFKDAETKERAFKVLYNQYIQGREIRVKRCQFRSAARDESLRENRKDGNKLGFKELQRLKWQQSRQFQRSGHAGSRPKDKKAAKKESAEANEAQVWEGERTAGKGLTREVAKLTKQWKHESGAAASATDKLKKTLDKKKRDERKERSGKKVNTL